MQYAKRVGWCLFLLAIGALALVAGRVLTYSDDTIYDSKFRKDCLSVLKEAANDPGSIKIIDIKAFYPKVTDGDVYGSSSVTAIAKEIIKSGHATYEMPTVYSDYRIRNSNGGIVRARAYCKYEGLKGTKGNYYLSVRLKEFFSDAGSSAGNFSMPIYHSVESSPLLDRWERFDWF